MKADLTGEWLALVTRMFTSLRTAVLLVDEEQARRCAAALVKTLEGTEVMARARRDELPT